MQEKHNTTPQHTLLTPFSRSGWKKRQAPEKKFLMVQITALNICAKLWFEFNKDVNKDYIVHTEGLSVASSVTVTVLLVPSGHSAIPSLRSQYILSHKLHQLRSSTAKKIFFFATQRLATT